MADDYTTTTGETWLLDGRDLSIVCIDGKTSPLRGDEVMAELQSLRAQRDEQKQRADAAIDAMLVWRVEAARHQSKQLTAENERDELLAIVEATAEHFADTDAPLGERARAAIAKVRNAKPAAQTEPKP